MTDRKIVKKHRVATIRSQIRHRGLGWWILRRLGNLRLRWRS